VKKSVGLLIALGIVVLGAAFVVLGLQVYLPRYVHDRVVAEARARGIDLTPGQIRFGWQWVQLTGARARLIGAPGLEAKLGLLDFALTDWKPGVVQATDVSLGVSGSLPRVLLELGEWSKNNPRAYELPLVASGVSLSVADAAAAAPWLELEGGLLTRTVVGSIFAAQSCKLSGYELGKVAAGYSSSGGNVTIGFGDQSAQAAPLRLDASTDETGGKMSLVLTPTKLSLLAQGLGIPLPLPTVVASGRVDLSFTPSLTASDVKGRLSGSLQGFIPPHPPELDGFVFGDTTTLDTDLSVDAARSRVTLTNTKVVAGRFELLGGGKITREGTVATAEVELKGALPCDALAGAAAESRLGQLLGRASGRQGRRTALSLVRGTVSVNVSLQARSDDPQGAKVGRSIGVGCGLKPLTLSELIQLTPQADDLAAIGGEVGKKLESLGRDLGLPQAPAGLPVLPTFPRLPLPSSGKKELSGSSSPTDPK
jgi:ADP-dependent NAD(P)H-hydrate dehydratase / NAD(P)H-hydrate epimerase